MKRSISRDGWLVVALFAGLLVAACASQHYRVTNPHSGNVYYTEKIDSLKEGAVKLKDARTGSTVTLQNSEVKEISSKEYKEGLATPVAKPAPATAPAPAAQPGSAPSGAQ
jgi:hypothetical protein